MSFTESLKSKVKEQSNFTCCWCRDPRNKIEVHHIIPMEEGGLDTNDNAAPLCSNCHTLYGGNPELRKEIRLRRKNWYKLCESNVIPIPGGVYQLLEEKLNKPLDESDILFQPREIHRRNLYVIQARIDIEYTIRGIAISHFGGWAGVTMSTGYHIFLDILHRERLIDDNLAIEIQNYYWYTVPFIRNLITDYEFLKIQYLTSEILSKLDKVPLGELGYDESV